MTSINSVTSTYQPAKTLPTKVAKEKEEIDFVFIFRVKGISLSSVDKAVGQILFNATKHKGVAEFTYNELENKINRSHSSISRALKKLAALFITEFIRSRISSLGYKEYNILKVSRSPEFYQIISQITKSQGGKNG